MGLFNDLFDKEKSNDEEDIYDLDGIEKEEVKNGEFDPWNFEEEDLDEEDYYSESE